MPTRHRYTNGIVSAPRPPAPLIGSYVRQLIHKVEGGTCLPWYMTPPRDGLPLQVSQGLDAGAVFGPVHDVDEFGPFISVKVPVPASLLSAAERDQLPQLVWINVYTDRHRRKVVTHHFCEVVAECDVREWHDHGWQDSWVLPEPSTNP